MTGKYAILLAISWAIVLLPGCRQTSTPPTASPATIEVGFDPTPPNAEARARIGAFTLPEIGDGSDGFVLRATDNKTTIIDTAVPEGEDAAYAVLKDILRRMVPVTDLCAYFETLARDYAPTPKKIVVVVYTDGCDDGRPDVAATRLSTAAARLADNPNVLGVVLVGLIRDTRPGWAGLPEMLAPLKERLHVIPQADMTPERILEEVEAVKATATRP